MTEESFEECRECAEEHKQLAAWLRDYKRLLEQENSVDWTPVTEDTPKGMLTKVLVSIEDELGLPLVPEISVYNRVNKTWDCKYKVVAWMPLPKSYNPKREG